MPPGARRDPAGVVPRPGRRARRPRAGAWRPVGQLTRPGGDLGARRELLRSSRGPEQRRRGLPEPSGGAVVPPGAGSGRAWPPGLQRRAQEVGVEIAGRGGGDRELGAGWPVAIATGEEEQAWPPRRRAGGVAGKARESCRPGTRPPPFLGSLTWRAELWIRTAPWPERGDRAMWLGLRPPAVREPGCQLSRDQMNLGAEQWTVGCQTCPGSRDRLGTKPGDPETASRCSIWPVIPFGTA